MLVRGLKKKAWRVDRQCVGILANELAIMMERTSKRRDTRARATHCLSLGVMLLALLAPRHAWADCFGDAAEYHHVNPLVLRAIALVESGGNPNALNRNRNGSYDLGEMQINSIHQPELARYGVSPPDLLDACKNIYIAAWILRRAMDKYGNTWQAIGAYNSATPRYRDRYAARVQEAVRTLLAAGYDVR